jgi:hypothetical protein
MLLGLTLVLGSQSELWIHFQVINLGYIVTFKLLIFLVLKREIKVLDDNKRNCLIWGKATLRKNYSQSLTNKEIISLFLRSHIISILIILTF